MPKILTGAMSQQNLAGKTYINAGHTDYDLSGHWRWIKSNKLQSIYFIHDLIPIIFPEFTKSRSVQRHSSRVSKALSLADGIITNSSATLQDIQNYAERLSLPMPSTLPVHLGTDHLADVIGSQKLQNKYFVCVSTIEPRKNHLMLLDVWNGLMERFPNQTPTLFFIGQNGFQGSAVKDVLAKNLQLARHVIVLNDCSDYKMNLLIKSAEAIVLPSKAEGYGLPLAEAMALGTPAICSDLPASREIGNGIPLFLPASDDAAWEEAIADFITCGRESMRQRNLLKLHRTWSWADHLNMLEAWMAADIPTKRPLPAGTPVAHFTSFSGSRKPSRGKQ